MSALERRFMSGLDRTFLSGLDRTDFPHLPLCHDQIKLVDVGLPLAPLLDHKQSGILQGLDVAADGALVQPHILGELRLARKAKVVLPCVGQEHGEGHFVARAEGLHFQKKVGDLGVALAGRRVGSPEDDVALFEDVADVPIG